MMKLIGLLMFVSGIVMIFNGRWIVGILLIFLATGAVEED